MIAKKIKIEDYINIGILLLLIIFPLIASPFRTGIMGKFIVFIIFAFSIDIIWGYGGLMSLGHAVLFGVGGYVIAIAYSIKDGVPGYMTRYGIETIPSFFLPLKNEIFTLCLALLLPAIIAAIIGYFIFTSKVSGVFFTIITLAFAQIFEVFIINQQRYTGGFNGISGIQRLHILGKSLSLIQLYYFILIITVIFFFLCKWLMNSQYGKVIRSIRDNENRINFLGYKSSNFKIFLYAFSGFLAGLSGVLYVSVNSFISPADVGVAFSTSVVVWLAVGGRGNLTGAIVGTLLMCWIQSILSEMFSGYWQLILGIIIVIIVFFMPDGLIGTLLKIQYSTKVSKNNKLQALAK